MTYPLIFYVKTLPPGVAGRTQGPVIRILERSKNDRGLYEHELLHAKQWWFTLGLHSFLYLLIPAYRLWSEVQAYKEQAKWYADDRRPLFAFFIATRYRLNITQAKALELLQ